MKLNFAICQNSDDTNDLIDSSGNVVLENATREEINDQISEMITELENLRFDLEFGNKRFG